MVSSPGRARARAREDQDPGPYARTQVRAQLGWATMKQRNGFLEDATPMPLPGILDARNASSLACLLPDTSGSAAAPAIARGAVRLLHALGYCALRELGLPSGRRADLVGVGGDGEIWIVEIKSSLADYRADRKWMDYRTHCDRLFFAIGLDLPREEFPSDVGLIVADGFDGAIVREAPSHRLAAATRRAMLLGFARAAALRLAALSDVRVP
jgi:hypothetical protein